MKGLTFTCLLFMSQCVLAQSVMSPTIAIIIDDMGHSYRNGADLAELPYPLTLSFLPGRRYTNELVELALVYEKEIMLHVPMENKKGFALGKGALTSHMTEGQLKKSLRASLASLPIAKGINNHMGSLLTTRKKSMDWVMETIQGNRYYFVDSRTDSSSVAANSAERHGIPNLSRDVFLDHEKTPSYIRDQFTKLIKIAKERGTAVAIGHPHKTTVNFLRKNLSKLGKQGISIATISGLLQVRNPDIRYEFMLAQAKTPYQ